MPMPAFETAPVLETPRLRLRPHRREDFAESAAMWADDAVVRHISGRPSTAEESWSRLLRYVGHWRLLGFGYWVAETRDGGRFVGEVGFADYRREIAPPQPRLPEAGWVLVASAHGRGYATEAVTRIVAWADRHLDSDRTFCLFDPAHAASIKVGRKAGYAGDMMARYRDRPALLLSRAADRDVKRDI